MDRQTLENLVLMEASYIKEKDATVRAVAREFNISKSTVSKHMNVNLARVNPSLAKEIHEIFVRHTIEGRQKGGLHSRGNKKNL